MLKKHTKSLVKLYWYPHKAFLSATSAWIEDNNIKPYQDFKEQLIKSCKTTAFKEAVAQIEDFMVHPEVNV